jgi:hypothetical protein
MVKKKHLVDFPMTIYSLCEYLHNFRKFAGCVLYVGCNPVAADHARSWIVLD